MAATVGSAASVTLVTSAVASTTSPSSSLLFGIDTSSGPLVAALELGLRVGRAGRRFVADVPEGAAARLAMSMDVTTAPRRRWTWCSAAGRRWRSTRTTSSSSTWTLLSYSEKDERHRGEYKKLANHVEALDENGQGLGIIFQTASPFDTPRLMAELVEWTRAALDATEYHRLLTIGVFVVRFLAIHPFRDGNGRLSRVLTTLLLLRAGYEYVPYSSLERVVEENKGGYSSPRWGLRRSGELK